MSLDYSDQMPAAGAVMYDGKVTAETRRCVHCSAQWVPKPGSGIRRGYCLNCKGLICGQDICIDGCVPLEARLQGLEAGLTKNQVLASIDSMGRTIQL